MKKIAFKKISRDCLSFFILTLLSISTIIWVLQAVNYLDFVIEEGHGFFVYFNFTLLTFPKILSRIYPFALFIAFSYILLKYENKNELVIFWNFGIKKISFVNYFIKFSIGFVIINLLLNAVIVPTTQDKARSFLRSSDLDFFESILKPRKFIDVINNLTIYFDQKTAGGGLEKIYLKDNSSEKDFQITIAKTGEFQFRGTRRILVLYDGKTLTNKEDTLSEFDFSRTEFNISNSTSTTTSKKTQENSTEQLINCLKTLQKIKHIEAYYNRIYDFDNCMVSNLENIYQEIYKRIIIPLYSTLLILISLLLIMKSKSDPAFRFYKFKIYTFGFLFIIFVEISSKFMSTNYLQNLFIFTMPFFFFFIFYMYFILKLKFYKK
jgi:lipopolysaccharide export system permease protein